MFDAGVAYHKIQLQSQMQCNAMFFIFNNKKGKKERKRKCVEEID
jgi:hypothetical protein